MFTLPQAIAIGKLKSDDGGADKSNSNNDMCKMAAHYKVKYSLESLEKTLSRATKWFSKSIDNEDVVNDHAKTVYDQSLGSSLPNLLDDNDSIDESKNDDTDDIPYMVMKSFKKSTKLQHSLSLDRLTLGDASTHKPLSGSVSSAGTFSSVSSDITTPSSAPSHNGHLHLPSMVINEHRFTNQFNHGTIYEMDDFNGEH